MALGATCHESRACRGNRLCLQNVSLIGAALHARALSGSGGLQLGAVMARRPLSPAPAGDNRPSRSLALARLERRGRARAPVLSWMPPEDPPGFDAWHAPSENGCCGTVA